MASASTGLIADASASIFDESFDSCATTMTNPHPYILTTPKGDLVAFFIEHEHNPDHVTSTALHGGCRACKARFRELHRVSGRNGPIMFPKDRLDTIGDPVLRARVTALSTICQKAKRGDITGAIVMRHGPMIYGYQQTEGFDKYCRSFFHSHAHGPETELSTADSGYLALVGYAFHRYLVVDKQMERLVDNLLVQGSASLELLMRILTHPDMPYGGRWMPAVKWLSSVLTNLEASDVKWTNMTPEQKFVFSAQQIINCGISPDFGDNSVCPLFSTAHGNIIPLLQSARDEEAMKKMCTERLNPAYYQRPTAAPSLGNVAIARATLGDFTNTVMTLAELKELVPTAVFHATGPVPTAEPVSSLSAFATLESAARAGAGAGSSFAARCGRDMLAIKIGALRTVHQFVEFGRAHPEIPVFLVGNHPSHHRGYCAKTTLSTCFLAVPHLWSVELKASGDRMVDIPVPPRTGLVPIIATVLASEYSGSTAPRNVFFVTADAKYARNPMTTNCCYPEFLKVEVRRVCGTAFEALNGTMPLVVPSEPIVAGIAITDMHSDHSIVPLQLMISGFRVTLTHYC